MTTQTTVTGTGTAGLQLSLGDSNMVTPTPGGTPDLAVTKTPDAGTVMAGQTIGFTITVSNTGTAPANNVSLTDPLPAGTSSTIFWSIQSQSPPNTFQITGAQGSQGLTLINNGNATLAAGASWTVHITSPTSTGDVGIGNGGVSFDTTGTPAAGVITLGAAGNFSVLGLNINNGNLIINSATIAGNVGIGPNETASALQKATVTGALCVDPIAGPIDLTNINKDFNVAGGVVTKNLVPAQTDALAAYNAAAALTPDFTLGNVTTSTTITATAASRADGVTVVSMSSLSYKSSTLTLVGGATDVFVIDILGDMLFAQSQIVLNGVTPNHVLFNLVGANAGGQDVRVNKDSSVWQGSLLAPYRNVFFQDPGHWTGEIIGGQTLKVYSGAIITGQLVNTATVTATNVTFEPDDTATASITITPSHQDLAGAAVVGSAATPLTPEELQPLLAAAIARWEATGIPGQSRIDLSTAVFGIADLPSGVLGLTYGNTILIDRTAGGHGWFIDVTPGDDTEFVGGVAADPAAVGKVDLLTVVTHELGHVLGYGEDGASTTDVMAQYLAPGARHLSMADEVGRAGPESKPVLADATAAERSLAAGRWDGFGSGSKVNRLADDAVWVGKPASRPAKLFGGETGRPPLGWIDPPLADDALVTSRQLVSSSASFDGVLSANGGMDDFFGDYASVPAQKG